MSAEGTRVAAPGAGPLLGWGLTAALLLAVAYGADGLAPGARWTLAVFIACIAGWALARLHETTVAVAGVAVLLAAGALAPAQLAAAAGHELVLLLAAAGVLAHALQAGGLVLPLAARALRGVRSVRGLAWRLALPIALSAYAIPSTTARAALLLPLFGALAAALGEARQARVLALLFPSVILLSAGAALTGAGAHLVAVDFIAAQGGPALGFLGWALFGLPFALLSVAAAVELILRLFLSADERRRAPRLPADAGRQPLDGRQRRLLAVLALTVLAWLSAGWHGLGLAIPALLGAGAALAVLREPPTPTQLLGACDARLLVFVIAALALGDAVVHHGLGPWLAAGLAAALPGPGPATQGLALAATVAVALLAHLLLPSRTARAAVLIPALALPLQAFALNPAALALLIALASGYCQTTPLGAKAIALYMRAPGAGIEEKDLLRLALALLPVMAAVSLLCATLLWPALGLPWRQGDGP